MPHHAYGAKVTSGGNVIAPFADVTENGGVVKVYVPDGKRMRALGWMRYLYRKQIGDVVRYTGHVNGKPTVWNVELKPCRSCR